MTAEPAPTVAALLDQAARRLREAGVPDPRRDAATLLAFVLATDRGGVAARMPDPVSPEDAARLAVLIVARATRAPLQHLVGHAEFFGLDLKVTPDVLIPRPETEGLVQAVLDAGLSEDARVADLGTGSGCIAIALAVRRPGWRITAVDRSREALAVARANAEANGVAGRIELVEADFSALLPSYAGTFSAVLSNPPYVSEAEWRELAPEVRDHEPKAALVPGPEGTEAYAALVPVAHALLAPPGFLCLELGWKSAEAVRGLAASAGFADIEIRRDFQEIPRVLTARR